MFFLTNCAIASFLSMLLPESPRYLVVKGDFKRARMAFNYIAKINGKKSGLDPGSERFIEELEYLKLPHFSHN